MPRPPCRGRTHPQTSLSPRAPHPVQRVAFHHALQSRVSEGYANASMHCSARQQMLQCMNRVKLADSSCFPVHKGCSAAHTRPTEPLPCNRLTQTRVVLQGLTQQNKHAPVRWALCANSCTGDPQRTRPSRSRCSRRTLRSRSPWFCPSRARGGSGALRLSWAPTFPGSFAGGARCCSWPCQPAPLQPLAWRPASELGAQWSCLQRGATRPGACGRLYALQCVE